jgi:hypothetical protein
LQQLLREWESTQLAPVSGPAAPYRRSRAPAYREDTEPTDERPVDLLFVPCPCDGCEFRQRCATGLACERYSIFLNGNAQKRWEAASYVPTHAAFEALFGDVRPGVPTMTVEFSTE